MPIPLLVLSMGLNEGCTTMVGSNSVCALNNNLYDAVYSRQSPVPSRHFSPVAHECACAEKTDAAQWGRGRYVSILEDQRESCVRCQKQGDTAKNRENWWILLYFSVWEW